MTPIVTCARALVAGVVLAVTTARTVSAHPIHTTMTSATLDAGSLTLSVRTFADDFSASVAAFAGRPAPSDWVVSDADVDRYLAAKVRVLDGNGRALPLESCGVRRERDLYWVCARVSLIANTRGLRLENRLLAERHADQVNIVQFGPGGAGTGGTRTGGTRRTLLFTRSTQALALTD